MSSESKPGAQLARRRWDRPEAVDSRVDALARRIRTSLAKLPRLTIAQHDRLVAVIKAAAP